MVSLCFSVLEKRVFKIALFEMDLSSFLHWVRVVSCSALDGVDWLRERSLALYGMCMAKR